MGVDGHRQAAPTISIAKEQRGERRRLLRRVEAFDDGVRTVHQVIYGDTTAIRQDKERGLPECKNLSKSLDYGYD